MTKKEKDLQKQRGLALVNLYVAVRLHLAAMLDAIHAAEPFLGVKRTRVTIGIPPRKKAVSARKR